MCACVRVLREREVSIFITLTNCSDSYKNVNKIEVVFKETFFPSSKLLRTMPIAIEYQEISGAAASKFVGFVGSHLVNNCPKNYVFMYYVCGLVIKFSQSGPFSPYRTSGAQSCLNWG